MAQDDQTLVRKGAGLFKRAWRRYPFLCLALAGLIVYHGLVIMRSRLFPFMDLPVHLASATVLRHLHDPSTRFGQYFESHLLFRPNIAHLVWCGLKIFPSVETANRVFLCLYAALLPLSAVALIRRAGGNPWFGALSALLLYNFNMTWGFVDYVFAIPLVLLTLALADRFTTRGGWRSGAALAAAFPALFLVHALGALFALMVYGAICLARFRGFSKKTLAWAAAALPIGLWIALWWHAGQGGGKPGMARYLAEYYRGEFLRTFHYRSALFHIDHSALLEGAAGRTFGKCVSWFIIFMAAGGALLGWRRLAGRWRAGKLAAPLALTLCGLACFLVLPVNPPVNPILQQRFACYFWLGVIVLGGAAAPARLGPLWIGAICMVVLFHAALCGDYLAVFQQENEGFTPGLMPKEGTVAVVTLEGYRGAPQVYNHYANYQIVWHKQLTVTALEFFNMGLITARRGAPKMPEIPMVLRFEKYDGRYRNVDAYLIRGEVPRTVFPELSHARLVKELGKWRRYRNQLTAAKTKR